MDRPLEKAPGLGRLAGLALSALAGAALACSPAEQAPGAAGFVLESAEVGLAFDEAATLEADGQDSGPGQGATLPLRAVDPEAGRHRAAFAAVDAAGNERRGAFELIVGSPSSEPADGE